VPLFLVDGSTSFYCSVDTTNWLWAATGALQLKTPGLGSIDYLSEKRGQVKNPSPHCTPPGTDIAPIVIQQSLVESIGPFGRFWGAQPVITPRPFNLSITCHYAFFPPSFPTTATPLSALISLENITPLHRNINP